MTHAFEDERDAWVQQRITHGSCSHGMMWYESCEGCLKDAWDAGYAKAHAP